MINSKILPGTFIAVAALLSGLTVATAQTAPASTPVQIETTDNASDAIRVEMRKVQGDRRGHGMMGQMMQQADANGDGALTQVEIDTYRAAAVANADASKDGDISLAEFETIFTEMARDRMVDAFQSLDADGDGAVTQAEMDTRFGTIVERMDRDDNGQLDREDRGGRGHKGQGRDGSREGGRRG